MLFMNPFALQLIQLIYAQRAANVHELGGSSRAQCTLSPWTSSDKLFYLCVQPFFLSLFLFFDQTVIKMPCTTARVNEWVPG